MPGDFLQRRQYHALRSHSAAAVSHFGVVSARRINGGMPKHIRHQVNIASFLIEVRRKSAAELMRADFRLQRRGNSGILLHEILHGALRNPPLLQG